MEFHHLSGRYLIKDDYQNPIETISNFMLNQPYLDTRNEMNEMLLAASSKKKKKWIKENPGNCLWNYQQFVSLLLAGNKIFRLKLYEDRSFNEQFVQNHAEQVKGEQICNGVILHHLTGKEFKNPSLVFKKAFSEIELEEWLEFIHSCIMNTLSWEYKPEWFDIPHQVRCTLFTFKILDACFLINYRIKKAKAAVEAIQPE
ncbi:hypothetical protein [Litoribacter populi]|uniref:hypothetical protein n=1 Tax=Litoribacter populi TaxID=2598460 RepID=UPI00117E48D3|nr:hypothetical protein [Litoribacter populi]